MPLKSHGLQIAVYTTIPDSTSPFGCYRYHNTLWNLSI